MSWQGVSMSVSVDSFFADEGWPLADPIADADMPNQTVVIWLRTTSAALSVIGSLLIIFSYFLFPRTRTFGRKLLCILSFQDLGVAIAYALPGDHAPWICKTQAVFITFFACSSVTWTTCIAWYIYKSVHVTDRAQRPEQYQLRFHLLSWIYSIGSAAYVANLDVNYGGLWCWIPNQSFLDEISKFVLFYVPLWLIWVLNIAWYALASLEIRRLLAQREARAAGTSTPGGSSTSTSTSSGGSASRASGATNQLQQHRKLIFIPLILVLLRVGGSAHRVYDQLNKKPFHILAYIQAIGDPGQGFADALLFVVANRSIRSQFARVCCRRGRNEHSLGSVTAYGTVDHVEDGNGPAGEPPLLDPHQPHREPAEPQYDDGPSDI